MKPAWRDAAWLTSMITGYVASLGVPRRFDPDLTERLARLLAKVRPSSVERVSADMTSLLGPEPAGWRDAAARYRAMKVESAWGRIRGIRPRGWRPTIRLEGLEHVRAGLEARRGVILWRMGFCSSPIAKAALWSAGIPLVHLSRIGHGAKSTSWMALRLLCPLHRRSEDWYLKERITIPLDESRGYMRLLMKHLENNAVVSIFGELHSRRPVNAAFFRRSAGFAAGAPFLAWKMGSVLLPTYCVRQGPSRYRVVVDEPIVLDPGLERDPFVRQAVVEFSQRLQVAIRASPSSWLGWGRLDSWPGEDC